jgi:DNA polymerase III sliding clamp (beta) subunit (PCNA family)
VLGDNSLKLIAANAEQEEAQEEIEVDYTGDIIDVGFNVGYLLDVLNNARRRNSVELQRRQLQRPDHPAGQRPLQVRRDADAHLIFKQ